MLFLPTDSKLLSTQFTRASSTNKRRQSTQDKVAASFASKNNKGNNFGTLISAGNKKKLCNTTTNNAYFGIKRASEDARNLITYMGNIQKKHNATIVEGKDYGISPSSQHRTMTTMSPKAAPTPSSTYGNSLAAPYPSQKKQSSAEFKLRPESAKLEKVIRLTGG